MDSLFSNRTYRTMSHGSNLAEFSVTVKETNLFIRAEQDLTAEAHEAVMNARSVIEHYIHSHPDFQTSLVPLPDDPFAPPLVTEMIRDSGLSGVGPMASVAGAIAEFVARRLARSSGEVIVENGGDIFLISGVRRVVALYVREGGAAFGLEILDAREGLGISSSSAVIGRSLSLGTADLATVVARTGALSDAAATALGNRVKKPRDIERALGEVCGISGVRGAVAIADGKIGIAGDVRIVALSS